MDKMKDFKGVYAYVVCLQTVGKPKPPTIIGLRNTHRIAPQTTLLVGKLTLFNNGAKCY
jgi:hypothetical protein